MTIETAAPVSAPVEEVTPIKPSEALRLGRLVRPYESPGVLFADGIAACAIGAMAVGYGWHEANPRSDSEVYEFVREHSGVVPWLIADAFDDAPDGLRDAAVLLLLESRGL